MSWRWFLSRDCLLHPTTFWLLLLCYVPGTVYGYVWYGDQLAETWLFHPHWQIVFVPDSPTASLFFTLAVIWLKAQPKPPSRPWLRSVRGIVEALGVVTSIKYGVWATAVIFASAAQGTVLVWEHWMLVIGHLAMALCALAYARFFSFRSSALAAAAAWTFLNDTVDYRFGVFPWLPDTLMDDLTAVCLFTFCLTALSVALAAAARWLPGGMRERAGQPF